MVVVAMMRMQTGPANHNWQGGRVTDPRGYVLIRVGVGHHLADVRGYAYEHRLVVEEKLGRRLRLGEQVHHLNENKSDNRPENLTALKSLAHHRAAHRGPNGGNRRLPDQENNLISCACGCGEMFLEFDKWGRPRKRLQGHQGRFA